VHNRFTLLAGRSPHGLTDRRHPLPALCLLIRGPQWAWPTSGQKFGSYAGSQTEVREDRLMVWIAGGPSGPGHWAQCIGIPAVGWGQVAGGPSAKALALDPGGSGPGPTHLWYLATAGYLDWPISQSRSHPSLVMLAS
jgi:hypothetical protein